jgi:hypothetical protein
MNLCAGVGYTLILVGVDGMDESMWNSLWSVAGLVMLSFVVYHETKRGPYV